MNSPDVIRLDELSFTVRNKQIVRDISLAVSSRDFLALVGPSGSGKSTVLKLIAGVHHPTRGRIHLRGRDVTNLPPEDREVLMVWQTLALFPHMTVGENVAFGLSVRSAPAAQVAKRVTEALELVDLPGIADRSIHQLSGGEKQRVALARALVMRPRILLLDEPLNGLDARRRAAMLAQLRAFKKDWAETIVMVTHDLAEAMTNATRVAVMRDGMLEQVDTPEGVADRPATAFVAEFIGNANLVTGHLHGQEPDGRCAVSFGTNHILPGRIPEWAPRQQPPDSAVAYAIAPRFLRINAAGPIGIEATIELRRDFGGKTHLELRTAALGVLKCEVDGLVPGVGPGDSVAVSWDPDHAMVLPL